MPFDGNGSTRAAVEALQRGYTAIPIRTGSKAPHLSGWTHIRWESPEQASDVFDKAASEGAAGVGLLLGKPSSGLIDVDLDHPKALRLRDYFLPKTAMMTGRPGRPRSHCWYRVIDDVPGTRTCKMPDGSMIVELRSTGAQTVIPPTVHPDNEAYRWEGEPWGGSEGPRVVPGRELATQVALLGMAAVLTQEWPSRGGRHEAYLALAGGLLRYGDGVHPYWQRNLPVLIENMAYANHDEEAGGRVSEVMATTITKLREKGRVSGFPKLGEIIGVDFAEQARRLAREVEKVAWRPDKTKTSTSTNSTAGSSEPLGSSTLPPEQRNPLNERLTAWSAVDLEPYLSKQVVMEPPALLRRTDGKCLIYPGRVNSLFGKSESAKSWIALLACAQEMAKGGRILYLDFEDGPEGTIARLEALGCGPDDIQKQFRYVVPDGPLADMQRSRWGGAQGTSDGEASAAAFLALLDEFDPTLIIADGMTVLYGLHGHDTNDAMGTEVITGWLKKLSRRGSTVIVIDHTGKGENTSSSPIGAHHKVAMIQGAAFRVETLDRPMPGKVGTVRLIVFKDRPGAVRIISSKHKEQVAGTVTLDSTHEGQTKMWIDPPNNDEVVIGNSDAMSDKLNALGARQELMDKILEQFDDDPELLLTTPQMRDALSSTDAKVRKAWEELVLQGKVVQIGDNNHRKYRLSTS